MKISTLRKTLGDLCYYCKEPMVFGIKNKSHRNQKRATIEHLICAYESINGKRIGGLDNCVLACFKCNSNRDKQFTTENRDQVIIHNFRMMINKSAKNSKHAVRLQTNIDNLLKKYDFLKDHLTSSPEVV